MVSATVRRYPIFFFFFLLKTQDLDMHDIWFQQNGATCHSVRVTMDLLRGECGEHYISRSGPVNWPPISCDSMLLDYILWGFVKAHVYTDKPASNEALKDNIKAFIRKMPAEMLERVGQNWTKLMNHLTRNRGLHFLSLNYMVRTIASNRDFMHFSEIYVFFFNCPIPLKKSPDTF